MKRLFLMLVIAVFSAVAVCAAPPRLETERLFSNDAIIKNKRTNVSIFTYSNNYFRKIDVNGDKNLVETIKAAVDKDRKSASGVSESIDGGTKYTLILNIKNGEYTINIGFTRTSDDKASVFIQGSPDAFK